MRAVRAIASHFKFGHQSGQSRTREVRGGTYLNNCNVEEAVGDDDVSIDDDDLRDNTFDYSRLDFYPPSRGSRHVPVRRVAVAEAAASSRERTSRPTDVSPQRQMASRTPPRDARGDDDPLLQDLNCTNFELGINLADDHRNRLTSNPLVPKHCHTNSPKSDWSRARIARNKLIVSSVICFLFMCGEAIGGYFAGSLAVMTDAAHLLSDLAAFLISLFALWVGNKKPSKSMSYGYYRAEILGATISVLLIWLLTGILIYLAIERVIHRDFDIDADVMMIVSGIGIAVNILMAVVLQCFGEGHGHSHGGLSSSHSVTASDNDDDDGHQHSRKTKNMNVRAAFIHIIGDLIQSIGVFISAVIIKFKPDFILADPICTFVFSIIVLVTTLTIMRDAVYILMEGFPRNLNYREIKMALENIEGVKMVHDMHAWSLTLDKVAFTVHLAVGDEVANHVVLESAEALLQQKYKIFSVTVQLETFQHSVMSTCDNCQNPADL